MARPRGTQTARKEFRLEATQVEQLEGLIETAPLGRPTLVSLVRQAVDEFICRELAKPGVREQVEAFVRKRHKRTATERSE